MFLKQTKKKRNSNLLAHPITLEYIKSYDMIINFKNLIIKSLPRSQSNGLFARFHDKLSAIKMTEFNKSLARVTPQIINMTSSIDQGLNEIQVVFSHVIDELVNAKYELVEKDHELAAAKKLRPMSGGLSLSMSMKFDETALKEKESQLNEKEEVLNSKERVLQTKEETIAQTEVKLVQKEGELSEKEKMLLAKEAEIAKIETEIEENKKKLQREEEKWKRERDAASAARKNLERKSPVEAIKKEKSGDKLEKQPFSPKKITLAPSNSVEDFRAPLEEMRAEAGPSPVLVRETSFIVSDEKYSEIMKDYQQLQFKFDAKLAEFSKQIE